MRLPTRGLGHAARGALAASLAAWPLTAGAQDIEPIAPALGIEVPEYEPLPIVAGGFNITAGATLRLEYDSNVYALSDDALDDVHLDARPFVVARRDSGTTAITLAADALARRFATYNQEDSLSGGGTVQFAWRPTSAQEFQIGGGYRHAVEDRGIPEGLNDFTRGPREFDILDANVGYTHRFAQLGVTLKGDAFRYRYDRAADEYRDLDSYNAVLRLSHPISPLLRATAEGGVTWRDYRLPDPLTGRSRDANTYAGRLGLGIDPGGLIRGEVGVGIYRFDADDPLRDDRTGFSARANVIWQPRRRTAVILEGFSGDVATYRNGVSSRRDASLRLGVQNELLHNLRWQSSVFVRRTDFYGTDTGQTTYGAFYEAEYLVSRNARLGLALSYADRNSDLPFEDFERFRGAVTLRVTL
ncbi:outer membrane beta-barrel protein [Aurantiacibacter spongiae]|uniref:Outer membrane beta-barrel protein n=1 Tax=Aurantiacibacter spongiae TaxID=2488860 RepID=A0A3N5CRC8_9SPHN|nr:outer membrane beta-barrel protein [Aurantiacibacter spongiae]RPF71167.1 hypothetical protein EG799_05730 [Aurantiacibacter spongiae]